MAIWHGQVTDLAIQVSTDPEEIVATADAVVGVAAVQTGISADAGATVTLPDFGFAGAFVQADDATYVDPDDGTLNATDRWFPGNGFADGYLNEKAVAFGHVTEKPVPLAGGGYTRPVGKSDDIDLID